VHGEEIDPLGPEALAQAVKVIELETPETPLPAVLEATYSLSRLWKRPGIPGQEAKPPPKPPPEPKVIAPQEAKVMGPPMGTPTPLATTQAGVEVQLIPARVPLPPALVLLGFTLLMGLGIGAMVLAYRTFGGPEQDGLTPPAEIQAQPGPPSAVALPAPAPAPTAPREAPISAPPERRPRPPKRPDRTAEPSPTPPPPPPSAPASPDEIWRAIDRLERSDPAAAAKMRATFVEANNDGAKLRALGEEVRRALSGSH
jgi:hypothetical protein